MERYHKQVVVRDKIVCIRFEIKTIQSIHSAIHKYMTNCQLRTSPRNQMYTTSIRYSQIYQGYMDASQNSMATKQDTI